MFCRLYIHSHLYKVCQIEQLLPLLHRSCYEHEYSLPKQPAAVGGRRESWTWWNRTWVAFLQNCDGQLSEANSCATKGKCQLGIGGIFLRSCRMPPFIYILMSNIVNRYIFPRRQPVMELSPGGGWDCVSWQRRKGGWECGNQFAGSHQTTLYSTAMYND